MQTIPFIDLTRPFAQLQQGSMVLGLAILALIIFGASVLIEAIVLWLRKWDTPLRTLLDSFLANLTSTIALATCHFFQVSWLDTLPNLPLLLYVIPILIFSIPIEAGFLSIRRNRPVRETTLTVTIANLVIPIGSALRIIWGGSLLG